MNRARQKAEQRERNLRLRHHQDRIYGEWLRLRAHEADYRDERDEDVNADIERMDELERILAQEPCGLPWQVFRKIEVLRHRLLRFVDNGADNSDELIFLAGIEVDLVRFGFGKGTEVQP
jgi:hypothetical protein